MMLSCGSNARSRTYWFGQVRKFYRCQGLSLMLSCGTIARSRTIDLAVRTVGSKDCLWCEVAVRSPDQEPLIWPSQNCRLQGLSVMWSRSAITRSRTIDLAKSELWAPRILVSDFRVLYMRSPAQGLLIWASPNWGLLIVRDWLESAVQLPVQERLIWPSQTTVEGSKD